MKKQENNFIVFYTENASPKVKQFSTRAAAIRFANKHETLNQGQYSDEWVDCIVEGKIVKTYRSWYGEPVKGK